MYNLSQPGQFKSIPTWKYTERKMKKLLVVSAVAGLIVAAALAATVRAQKSKKVVYASLAQATYKPSQMKGVFMSFAA